MSDIAELERRITAALERIGSAVESLPAGGAPAEVVAEVVAEAAVVPQMADTAPASDTRDAEIARLQAALDAEKASVAQLQDRLRASRDKDGVVQSQQDSRVDRMTRQLDVQGLELQRMRKTAITLREQLRAMRHAQASGVTEPHLINKSMLAELEALRSTRLSEMAEMDDIIAELTPMITEAEHA